MEYCFYLDFAGWNPEVYAAWAQAFLSGLAIWYAGRIAVRQHQREIAQRVGALVALLARASDEVEEIAEDIDSAVGSYAAGNWVLERTERITKALKEVPVHELPDDGLAHPLLDTIEYLDRFLETASGARDLAQQQSVPLTAMVAFRLKTRADGIAACYGRAVEIERKHKPLTIRDRWRLRKARASVRSTKSASDHD